MGLKVKLDEDLTPLVGEPLRVVGHAVIGTAEQGWSGLKDPELWRRIVAEGVFFVTADKGFGDIREYPPGTHPGILLLRPERESIVDYRALLEGVARAHALESLAGTITVATVRGVRIRRAPGADPARSSG